MVLACGHGRHAARNHLHETAVRVFICPTLAIVVITRGPHTAISLQNYAVVMACIHGLHVARDHLHETGPGGSFVWIRNPHTEVDTRGPHTAIFVQYQAAPVACSHGLRTTCEHLLETGPASCRPIP